MRRIVSKYYKEFFLRGLTVMCAGPIVLAIIYAILGEIGVIESLTTREVSLGIFSLSLLAFLCAGMTVVFKMEELPIVMAILIHGFVIYFSYSVIYLVNGWLALRIEDFLVFTAIFFFTYLLIWAIIYLVTKSSTKKLNDKLKD